jgi:hypothetical protein
MDITDKQREKELLRQRQRGINLNRKILYCDQQWNMLIKESKNNRDSYAKRNIERKRKGNKNGNGKEKHHKKAKMEKEKRKEKEQEQEKKEKENNKNQKKHKKTINNQGKVHVYAYNILT